MVIQRDLNKVKEYIIEIPDVHPSLNTWTRMHFHVRNQLKHDWATMVLACARTAKIPKIDKPVRIFLEYYHPKRSVDIDNYTPKFILDPLRDHFIKDDNITNITDLRWTFVQDKVKRTVIHIYVDE